jgi:hypothetical protein
VLVANVSDESNLATGDICPVLTRTLLNLKQFVGNTQGVQLLTKLFGVTAIVSVRGIETTDNYVAVTHG